ncbi:hypothetical protein [Saccharothrix xinjiangensis]|uniref:YbaB/EbfC DNA-binding family protein n=1 Tax=Saccharothrix xinjiangensis TaxID=204798 RepID=A0ABV9XT52_9PSEU
MERTTEFQDLAARAASRAVAAMPTEAWHDFRTRLATALATVSSGGTAELAVVDACRRQLMSVEADDLAVVSRSVAAAVSEQLRQTLHSSPEIADELRGIAAGQPGNAPTVTQTAHATRRSQVFQAAGNQTIHLESPRNDR